MRRSKEWTDSYFESFVTGKGNCLTMGKGRRERWAIAASLVSVKKIFPASCECLRNGFAEKHKGKITQPVDVPQEYLDFVKTETDRMFPKGWDLSYHDVSSKVSRSLSACKERSKVDGGSFVNEESQEDYLEKVSGKVDFQLDTELKFCLVQSAGKPRPLSIASDSFEYLRPVHKLIYNHLSKKKWLLRGEATTERLASGGFRRKEGSLLISGDFEGATDNLSVEVTRTILEVLLNNSDSIPMTVKRECLRSITDLTIKYTTGKERVKRGQMMGSLLSFPLLCIQNRLSFLFSVPGSRRLPCLINGDDILFMGSRHQANCWFDGVGKLGLVASKGKTLVHDRYCCINSTYFETRTSMRLDRAVLYVPFIRVKQFLPPEDPSGLVGTLRQVLKPLDKEKKRTATSVWIESQSRIICRLGRSLYTLGLTQVPEVCDLLRDNSWLRKKERLLRSVPERSMPQPATPHNIALDGFVSVTVDDDRLQPIRDAAGSEMIRRKWNLRNKFTSLPDTVRRYWEDIRNSSQSISLLLRSTRSKKKIFRGLKLSHPTHCWWFSVAVDGYTSLQKESTPFDIVGKRKIKKEGNVRVPKEWVECGDFGLRRGKVEFLRS
uniref:Putative RdRp n=1 Tax=Podosphaera ourmiavirus A TaxID=2592713 RepID=A0A7G3W8U0_9VIRU|nr:putative RdRp [Podosphaera ourmiavirus A]